jgi:micrococcal nuclease
MKSILACLLALVAYTSVYSQKAIELKDAAHHIGDSVIVEGRIMDTRYFESASKAPALFNMGGKFPNQLLTLVIYGADRKNFKDAPEIFYKEKNVIVKGKIEEYKGKPQIIVKSPDQIEIISELGTPPAIKE